MANLNNKRQKLRFAITGLLNTAVDFIVFIALSSTVFSPIVANYFSTTAALVFSYFGNKYFAFASSGASSTKQTRRQIILFLAVTLVGIWIIQPLALLCTAKVLASASLSDQTIAIIGKLVATGCTFVWNYLMYSRVVFKLNDTSS